jgi:hypothetical protein
MKRNLLVILIVLSPVLSSCYRDIDMGKYRPEPDLVLNGVLSADTAVMLSISRTKFFTDTGRYEVVKDARVALSVNGQFYETMPWTADESFYGSGIYLSGYRPQTDDVVRIEAITPYGNTWVEETIPAKVRIEDVAFSHKLIYDGKGAGPDENGNLIEIPTMEITYRITFTDNASTTNYYLIRIDNSTWNWNIGNLDYSLDPVFVEQVSVVDGLFGDNKIYGQGGRAFTDHLLNGRRYTLVVKEADSSRSPYYSYAPAMGRQVFLYAITESYYHYLTSMQMAADAADGTNLSTFGFTEPVRIFTNIQGGVGIIATSQYDAVSIDLRDILTDYQEYNFRDRTPAQTSRCRH